MSTTQSNEELLESLDRHFMAGCPSLSTSQLRQHQASGSCRECGERAAAVVVHEKAAGHDPATCRDGDHYGQCSGVTR